MIGPGIKRLYFKTDIKPVYFSNIFFHVPLGIDFVSVTLGNIVTGMYIGYDIMHEVTYQKGNKSRTLNFS